MNDQLGFFSHVNKDKTNKPQPSRIPRIPIFRKPNPVLLTDDEDSSDDNEAVPAVNLKNNIFNTTAATSVSDLDKTYCSKIENKDDKSNKTSEQLFGTDELEDNCNSQKSRTSRRTQADTVVGSFSSDDEEDHLSAQLSGMNIKSAKKKSTSSRVSNLKDTVYDPFDSDESLDATKSNLTEKKVQKTAEKANKSSQMRETVIGSFDSDEDDSQENFVKPSNLPPKRLPPKQTEANLRETIDNPFEYSESDIDMSKKSSAAQAKLQDDVHSATDKFSEIELNDSEEEDDEAEEVTDSSDLECITVLDSDEEEQINSQLQDDDGPPKINPQDSYENCSSIGGKSAPSSRETDNTLNRFFNNPPSIDSKIAISHSIIINHFKKPDNPDVEAKKPSTIIETSENPLNNEKQIPPIDDSFELDATVHSEDEIVNGTIMTDENDGAEVSISEESFNKSANTETSETQETQLTLAPSAAVDTQDSEVGGNFEIGNLKLKINLNVEIALESESSSEESDDGDKNQSVKLTTEKPSMSVRLNSATKNSPRTPANTPVAKAPKNSNQKSSATKAGPSNLSLLRCESPLALPLSQLPKSSSKAAVDFLTPTRTNVESEPTEIDEDLQKILSDLYGETWKTPQLLKSCRKKKNVDNLRKSIAANNFESFIKTISADHDSTRVSESSPEISEPIKEGERVKPPVQKYVTPKNVAIVKPSSSVKKTPQNTRTPQTSAKSTPRYLEICDPETPSEESESSSEEASSDDDEFQPDESWNASSSDEADDGDEEVEDEPVKDVGKKKSIRRVSRKSKYEETFIFEPASAETKKPVDFHKAYEDLLDQFEFKKPTSMPGIDTPTRAKPKRKLFSHTHYEDDPEQEESPVTSKREESDKENDKLNTAMPFLIPKPIRPLPTPEIKKTPVSKPTPKRAVTSKTPSSTTSKLNSTFQTYSFLKSLDVESSLRAFCNPEALMYKENYKTKKCELAQKLFKIYNEKVFDNKLSGIEIKWNKKLLNTAGRCNNSRKNGIRQSNVELSDKVLTSADRLRCTLIHELCHAATWLFHGENGHGATWKSYAAKANRVFPELPKINRCHDYVIEYRYTYQCTHCKAKYQTHSKSKKVENIRCSICKSAIELFLNKKNKNGEIVMTPVSREVKGFPRFVKEKYKEIKRPNMAHKDVMQVLSQRFAALSAEEKMQLYE